MRGIFKSIKFAWDYIVGGKHRLPRFSDFDYLPVDEGLMNFLVGMYAGHGAHAFRADNWVLVDAKVLARASLVSLKNQPGQMVLQTDFVTVSPEGYHIVESFAGLGADLKSATEDACRSFQGSSFHVIYSTLLGHDCSHVEHDDWIISGIKRTITLGQLGLRGTFPDDCWPDLYRAVKGVMEAQELPAGLHWARVYYCNIPGSSPVVEVLVDNQPNSELQEKVGRLGWSFSEDYYSLRLFFIVQDAP